jgi:nucleoside-diphosphate-sugar epimerase
MDLSIFGGTGFIGSTYIDRWKTHDDINVRPRYSRRPDPYKKTDILYLISTTHNYHVFDDPTLDVRTNLVVLTEALESWKNNNPEGVFNFVSSWFVYGNAFPNGNDGTYREGNLCCPQGFYSITKKCAEDLIMSFCATHGLKYRILRLCNILGPGDKGVSKQKNALQYLMGEMVAGRPIEIYGKGDFFRTYMDVEDCVEALRLVMLDGNLNSTYNIGVQPATHFMSAIKYVHDRTDNKSEIRFIEPKAFHKQVQVVSFKMNCDKLYSLGFQQKYTTERTLDRILWVDHGK